MKLTTRGRYALQAMLDLTAHSNGRAVKLQDISVRQGISLHYLEQLFRKLRQSGVVKSVRGPGGGYVLAKAVGDIKIKEVLAGVSEKLEYKNAIVIAENSTEELKKLAGYLSLLDQSLDQALESSLEQLLGA